MRPMSKKSPTTGCFTITPTGFVKVDPNGKDGKVMLENGTYRILLHRDVTQQLLARICQAFAITGQQLSLEIQPK